MKYQVYLIADAEEDLAEIYRYIARHDSVESADYVFGELEAACRSLETLAQRGHVPPELDRINVYDYLEIHFKPYRIIYQLDAHKVYIHCILDGRRDMNDLLQRRLLR